MHQGSTLVANSEKDIMVSKSYKTSNTKTVLRRNVSGYKGGFLLCICSGNDISKQIQSSGKMWQIGRRGRYWLAWLTWLLRNWNDPESTKSPNSRSSVTIAEKLATSQRLLTDGQTSPQHHTSWTYPSLSIVLVDRPAKILAADRRQQPKLKTKLNWTENASIHVLVITRIAPKLLFISATNWCNKNQN